MNKINIKTYYNYNLIESFSIDISHRITSIDDARILVVNFLDNFYHDVKYKINVFTPFNGDTDINLEFENDICLNREILLRKILET